jgi:hypothetical protein
VSSRAKRKRERRACAQPHEVVLCAYCGDREGDEREHVFPKSWYPESTPESVQRLVVPGCHACNQRWKVVEEEFRDEFLMVISPVRAEAKGLHDKFTRSINPTFATDAEGRKHRAAKAMKILKTMTWVPAVAGAPQETIRTPSGLFVRASPVRRVEKRVLNGVGEKLMRGLHYAKTGEVLGPLTVHSLLVKPEHGSDPTIVPVLEYLWTLPPDETLAPGLQYRHHEQPGLRVWDFLVWGQVRFISFATAQDAPVPVAP